MKWAAGLNHGQLAGEKRHEEQKGRKIPFGLLMAGYLPDCALPGY